MPKKPKAPPPAAAPAAGKPSALLDTRVLKKTGSFYYHCDWHARRDLDKGSHLPIRERHAIV